MNIELKVFELESLDYLGIVNDFISLIWTTKYVGYGSFELWAPVNPENVELLKQGNILWKGGESAVLIEAVKKRVDDDGKKMLNIKGRTLEAILTFRVIKDTCINSNSLYLSEFMSQIVSENCINPSSDINERRLPYLELGMIEQKGKFSTFQKTGGYVYDAMYDLATSREQEAYLQTEANDTLGFEVAFIPNEKKFKLNIYKGIDRTISTSGIENEIIPFNSYIVENKSYMFTVVENKFAKNINKNDKTIYSGKIPENVVVFNTDLNDILTSSYIIDNSESKNVAYVYGEGEGAERKLNETTPQGIVAGFNRKELYVDAKDMRSKVTDANGLEVVISADDYDNMLYNRGCEKLSDAKVIETFDAEMRISGDSLYVFGVDYKQGDLVTVIDEDLQIMTSARITEVEEIYEKNYSLNLTFGFAYPTIMDRISKTAK